MKKKNQFSKELSYPSIEFFFLQKESIVEKEYRKQLAPHTAEYKRKHKPIRTAYLKAKKPLERARLDAFLKLNTKKRTYYNILTKLG